MDRNVDLTTYNGTDSLGDCLPIDPQPHQGTVREQLIDDLTSGGLDDHQGPTVFVDILTRFRDAMELVTNGLFSSMEYNAATLVASKHHARKVVLNHYSG